MIFFWLLIILLVILAVVMNIKIVPQSYAYVVERLGAYYQTWETGLHFAIPVIDKISRRISLKEQVIDFPPQPVITKDNVTIQVDTVVYMEVTDPKYYVYGVDNPILAIENLTATTLRNIMGDLELDETLTSRDTINSRIRVVIDEATDPWGIKINRVELKNILPPRDIQNAMEKQMVAERERRESILKAEGQKKSSVLVAEGNKEAMILNAEAKKQATILQAQAEKEAAIQTAEGKAEAIYLLQEAKAKGLKCINDVAPSREAMALESFKTLATVADGQSTKIIIPSDLQNLAGLVTSVAEIAETKTADTTSANAASAGEKSREPAKHLIKPQQ
ncbi:MAG: SPFH domain-containing protein [Eubacteriaceae bacterium]|jgi:regulator of protease activity HflC (stomatin/prohibitin superfamily)